MWSVAPLAITVEHKAILEKWVCAPSTPQGIALRSTIVLQAASGISNSRIARVCGISRPTVILWRSRFETGGPEALTEIKEGRGRKPVIPGKKLEAIINDTLHEKPADSTHWSTRTLAKRHGVSHVFIKQVWDANGFKPHLVRTFKLSNDPNFVEKLTDVVGLYLNPPEHALVFSIDEKSQIQALNRTQPSLPLKRGQAGTITHDYKRNGTTTLFAAFDILKGEVIGECTPRHRHQEFLRFLKNIDKAVASKLAIHCIVDNYQTHKHRKVAAWLEHNPRFRFHFIPTSSSWLNLVERWFGEITRKRIRRGSFGSVKELEDAIYDFIQHNNAQPKPFVWTKKIEEILAKVDRCKAILKTRY